MDQILPDVLQQGGLGVVAAIFFWLYMKERDDRKQAQKEKEAALEARRLDAKEAFDKVAAPLDAIAQNTTYIREKISTSREPGK